MQKEEVTIGWIQASTKKTGGKAYNTDAKNILEKNFSVEERKVPVRFFSWRYARPVEILLRLLFLKGKKSIWIRSFYSALTMPFDRTKGKNIIILHHFDFSTLPLWGRFIFFFLGKLFMGNAKKADAVVVVSDYWKIFFIDRGFKNIHRISNAFSIDDFNISQDEVLKLKRTYRLEGKPIIYIGNSQKAKGAAEVFDLLKDLPVYLVASGSKKLSIDAIQLDLSYRDYLALLKASDIVITMSQFKEGWCRTAHEAMLLKRPVIGSGAGGMEELLEGGGQIVCKDFKDLHSRVEFLLQDQEERNNQGVRGFEYAKDYSFERFEQEWLSLINSLA